METNCPKGRKWVERMKSCEQEREKIIEEITERVIKKIYQDGRAGRTIIHPRGVRSGYQPNYSDLNPNNPPQGGSGVPAKK